MEGPLCDGGKTTKCKPGAPTGSCYAFRTPSSYGKFYKEAGFDVVSTANNHSSDFGQTCRLETEKHLDLLGIKHSGRPGDIATMEVNGLKIAVIGFHTNQYVIMSMTTILQKNLLNHFRAVMILLL